jgi:hypothetical protein
MHDTYNYLSTAGGTAVITMSPSINALLITSDFNHKHVEYTAPLFQDPGINVEADIINDTTSYNAEDGSKYRLLTKPAGAKSDESYATLIYRAFMSRQNKSMALQDIYQWFTENTDKAKSPGKRWKSSIRHNLSMNKVRDSFQLFESNVINLTSDYCSGIYQFSSQ